MGITSRNTLSRRSGRSDVAPVITGDAVPPPNLAEVFSPSGCRTLTDDEFNRVLQAAAVIRRRDSARWQWFILGLRHSGLKVGRLRQLCWDASADVHVSTEFGEPLMAIARALSPSLRNVIDQPIGFDYHRMTAEMLELVGKCPERRGYLFPIVTANDGQMLASHINRILNEICAASGVARLRALDIVRCTKLGPPLSREAAAELGRAA
jgi:hypothetical protein